MKIAVRKIGPMGTTYGSQYGKDFFEKVWNDAFLSRLESNDDVVWVDHMPVTGDEFDKLLDHFEAVIGAWIMPNMITEEILTAHPALRYIGTISHGYSPFDKLACKKHNVTVTNTIFNDDSVAQHVFALLLEICNNVGVHNRFYKEGKWNSSTPASNKLYTRQIGLTGKTMGIIGLGNIGLKTARIAEGFGMEVIAYSRNTKIGKEYEGIAQASLDEVLQNSDVLSLHCAFSESTKNLISEKAIDQMKDGVIIINTSRGEIIDEAALNAALLKRKVYAAGLDVFSDEPLASPRILLCNPYVTATEHIAWASIESRIKSITVGCDNFFNWRAGHATSVISEE